jgi:thioredoxin reductase/ferredoxin
MGWLLLPGLVLTLALVCGVLILRRLELLRLSSKLSDLRKAKLTGSHRARLQYPHIDLSRCIGCGTCVKACPEDGVLDLIHGQAVVIHGARCVGHGMCAAACPVGAIDLTLADLRERRDIPAVSDQFEVCNVPGLFLGGEITGFALIRTATSHGTAIVDEIVSRIKSQRLRQREPTDSQQSRNDEPLDLCIVGAGPAGLAAALQAKAHGLRFVALEQDTLGGTIAKYPRRKLVMTQPVNLPLYGTLPRAGYSKEELMELWGGLARQYQLPIHSGQEFVGLERNGSGTFRVKTRTSEYHARFVCLALGRRGTPRKLGVAGENLPKVAYSLIDTQSYQHRHILVVGGGDSAIEAALGLSEQPGNTVTISYRQSAFFRLRSRNEARLNQAIQQGRVECIFDSQVVEITPDSVRLRIARSDQPPTTRVLGNDDVFIMAGGVPPFVLLESCGVSFDPADRQTPLPLVEQGTGLVKALMTSLALSLVAMFWVLLFHGYYFAPQAERPLSALHSWLRPSGAFGLSCGIAALLLIVANLTYLLRRNVFGERIPGSLTAWMTSHVVTGILALLLVLIHSAMAPRNTLGGHACLALVFLVVTGAIGRYLYSFVPRAANGQELALEELNARIAAESTKWDRYGRGFGDELRKTIHALVAAGKWQGTFLQRLIGLAHAQSAAKQIYRQLQQQGRDAGLSDGQVGTLLSLAQQAYRTALISAHYEDLRALLNSWRFFHRWVALLMVLLAGIHVYVALRYGRPLR